MHVTLKVVKDKSLCLQKKATNGNILEICHSGDWESEYKNNSYDRKFLQIRNIMPFSFLGGC